MSLRKTGLTRAEPRNYCRLNNQVLPPQSVIISHWGLDHSSFHKHQFIPIKGNYGLVIEKVAGATCSNPVSTTTVLSTVPTVFYFIEHDKNFYEYARSSIFRRSLSNALSSFFSYRRSLILGLHRYRIFGRINFDFPFLSNNFKQFPSWFGLISTKVLAVCGFENILRINCVLITVDRISCGHWIVVRLWHSGPKSPHDNNSEP